MPYYEDDPQYHVTTPGGLEYERQLRDPTAAGQNMDRYLAQERGLANQVYGDLESGKLSVAQKQMQAGLAGTQTAMAAQAAQGGANPLAQRAATYAGGQAGVDVSRQTSALRAQEMQAARQMQMGALSRGTEAQLAQQQMDLQAAQAAAQLEQAQMAEERAREEGEWDKTKDILGMASFGFISDPRMKDVYASDPATKTISAYMPQGGGRYGVAMPMPVAPPPTMLVEVPNPAWYPGDVSGPEEIVVQSSRPAMPPTISDYMKAGAYGPQRPVRQPGRAAVGAGAAGKAPKGEAPVKGAGGRAAQGAVDVSASELTAKLREKYPFEEYYSGPPPVGFQSDLEQGGSGNPGPYLDELRARAQKTNDPKDIEALQIAVARYGVGGLVGKRTLYVPGYSAPNQTLFRTEEIDPELARQVAVRGRLGLENDPWTVESPSMLRMRQAEARALEMRRSEEAQLREAAEAGLDSPARATRTTKLGGLEMTGETWEQMARRIEAEQRRKYYEQGGPGI